MVRLCQPHIFEALSEWFDYDEKDKSTRPRLGEFPKAHHVNELPASTAHWIVSDTFFRTM